jgi:hypothetical protein
VRASQLSCGRRRALDNRSDFIEGHVERVVQDERDPLGGGQPVKHHEERKADRIS